MSTGFRTVGSTLVTETASVSGERSRECRFGKEEVKEVEEEG